MPQALCQLPSHMARTSSFCEGGVYACGLQADRQSTSPSKSSQEVTWSEAVRQGHTQQPATCPHRNGAPSREHQSSVGQHARLCLEVEREVPDYRGARQRGEDGEIWKWSWAEGSAFHFFQLQLTCDSIFVSG